MMEDVAHINSASYHAQVFVKDIDKDMVILYAARASRVENQDAIDTCIVGMLADPKEVNLDFQYVLEFV